MLLGHEKILEELKSFNETGLFLIISDLLESGKLDISKFSIWCTQHIQNKDIERQNKFYRMAIMLGQVCTDPSEENKFEAMKYMWENGFHKSSKFGDILDEKFKDEKK